MKKLTLTLLMTLIFIFTYSMLVQAKPSKLYYDGKWHDYNTAPIFLRVNGQDVDSTMPPVVFGENSLVPAREVFEALGFNVSWNNTQQTISVSDKNTDITLKINSNIAKVNGVNKSVAVAPKIINDKTMIPVRFVSEQLGLNVDWVQNERTIYIAKRDQNIYVTGIRYVEVPQPELVSSADKSSKTVQVAVDASERVSKYNVMTLQNPDRLVIDMENSILKTQNAVSINKSGIQRVRLAQFSTEPNKTRVVIDLDKQMKYKTYLSDDKKHLIAEFVSTATNTTPVLAKGQHLIVIDPGHGGSDPGAVYSGKTEKELNLDISLRLKKLLEQEGIKVVMTREDDRDVDLYARSALANNLNADLLISIHNNVLSTPSYGGTMTLFYPDNDKEGLTNRRFAQIIQKDMVAALGTMDRGIIERPKLAVLRTSNVPTVLVECAFMTNPQDMAGLKDPEFRQRIAEALKTGLIKTLAEK